jgi:hypothetical protein
MADIFFFEDFAMLVLISAQRRILTWKLKIYSALLEKVKRASWDKQLLTSMCHFLLCYPMLLAQFQFRKMKTLGKTKRQASVLGKAVRIE